LANTVHYAQATILNVILAGSTTPAASTPVYAGLSTVRAQRYAGRYAELNGTTAPGYSRVALPPVAWSPSSAGTASNAQAITFPTATAAWSGIRAIVLFDAGGNGIAIIEVAPSSAPLSVAGGTSLSLAPGSLAVRQTAHRPTRWQSWGPAYEDAINNYWLRGAALSTPTLYLALSTAPANPGGPPTEPSGAGYGRVSLAPATVFPVKAFNASRQPEPYYCRLVNAVPLAFPTPNGSWGTILSVYLMDAAAGGNVIAAGDLTIPRTIGAGSTPPSFAPGALWISRS
jgi:hypothetical protein